MPLSVYVFYVWEGVRLWIRDVQLKRELLIWKIDLKKVPGT